MRGFYLPIQTLRRLLVAGVDVSLLVLAFLAAAYIRFAADLDGFFEYPHMAGKAVLTAMVVGLSLYYNELYEESGSRRRLDMFINLARAFIVGAAVLSLVSYAFPAMKIGRSILTLFLPLAFGGLLAWRTVYLWAFGSSALSENVLILGTGQSARQIAEELLKRTPLGFRIVGFLGEHRAEVGRRLVNPSVIGTIDDLAATVRQRRVNVIVVALDDRRGKMPVEELLRCRLDGVRVEEVTSFFEALTGKILVRNLRPSWLVFSQGFSKPRLVRNAKRAWEFTLSIVILALLAPLLVFIALMIKMTSAGPVFYRQERVGEKGRTFHLVKFRTMRTDAEAETGPVWAAEGHDPRVTAVGRWLRNLRLDELPQLWNVFRGEMSFVGPRPERPQFVAMLRRVVPYYDQRHTVPPGITGWAQVKFSYGATIEDSEQKLEFDLYYIKHMSVLFDVAIMLDTFKVMALGRGAR